MAVEKNTAKAKGVRTAIQTVAATVVTYLTGLVALPAVREYTNDFVRTEGLSSLFVVLGALGVSAGIIAYIQNKVEDK